MDDEFLDYAWWILKRNLWDMYFPKPYKYNDKEVKPSVRFGAEDYLHALAALHRGNRYKVITRYNGKQKTILCYKFLGKYHPLNDDDVYSWSPYIDERYIKKVTQIQLPENNMVEIHSYGEWEDLSIYDKIPEL